MADESKTEQKAATPIPITEQSEKHRRIPRAIFIEDTDAWVDKYGDDQLFA